MRKVYRFTVDASDVVPVTVGPVRSWFVREVDFGVAVSDVSGDVEVQSMKLPKSVPGVNRGMLTPERLHRTGRGRAVSLELSLGWDCSVLQRTVQAWRNGGEKIQHWQPLSRSC